MSIESQAIVLLFLYSAIIVLSSLLGGWLPQFIRLTHTRIQTLISLVGGLMVGVAVFHLLPHAVSELGIDRIDEISWAMMLGMLIMFFMLRFFHFHQHESPEILSDEGTSNSDHPSQCDHSHDHDHGHDHGHHSAHHHDHGKSLSWTGVLFGLGFHTLLDGVALASAVQVESHHSIGATAIWGLGVFLAILLHKPLDAMSITALMRAQQASSAKMIAANLAFASMVPFGAFLVVFFGSRGGYLGGSIAGWGLAFSAGVFLCISLSDLLPEMEFHSHHRVQMTVALLLGVAVAWGIGFLEPKHLHDHKHIHTDEHPIEPSFVAQIEAVQQGTQHTIDSHEPIADALFRRLEELKELEELSLSNASLTDESAATLQSLTGLKRLRIEKASLGDLSAKAIGTLSSLLTINIPDSRISNDGIQSWSGLPELILLRIGSPNLTDHSLTVIGKMSHLRFLHLIDLPITDAGLEELVGMRQLESFYLDGGQASDGGLAKLLEALPELHFHRDQQHLPRDPLADDHPAQ